MSRRHKAEKREIFPDPKYRDEVISKFMNNWMEINTPTGAAGMDDITPYSAIPEFSTLLMPIASVMLIVGNRIRNKD